MFRTIAVFLLTSVLAFGQATPWAPNTFKQPLTSSVSTTQASLNQRSVSVFDWMSAAMQADVKARTKTLDCTAAIQLAMTNTPDGVTLIFPKGTYKVSGASAIERTRSGDLHFEQGAIIDAQTSTASYIFYIHGTRGTSYVNVAAITAGSKSFTAHATLAASLAPGDMLALSTNTSFGGTGTLWYGGRNYYWRGELLEVREVSGTTVYLKNTIRESYAGNEVAVARIAYVQTKVQGATFIGSNLASPEQAAVYIQYGKNCEIDGGETTGFSYAGYFYYYVLGGKISKAVTDGKWFSGIGTGYGVSIASSQTISVSDCRLVGPRTGLTTGGNEPCRDVMVVNSFLDSDNPTADGCIDTHGNIENFIVSNCTLNNGALLTGKNDKVDACTVFVRGFALQYSSDWQGTHTEEGFASGCSVTFTNNIITAPDSATAINAVKVSISGTVDQLNISKNRIFTGAGTSSAVINIATYAGTTIPVNYGTITELDLDDNYWKATHATVHGFTLATPVTVTNARIRRNTSILPGGAHYYWVGANSLSTNIDILDNNFTSTALNSYSGLCATSGAARIRFNRNTYNNTNTLASGAFYAFTLSASAYVELCGNYFYNMKNRAVDAIAPMIRAQDNTRLGITGADNLFGKVFHTLLANGSSTEGTIAGAASATNPSAGVFAVGDRLINTTATVGTAKAYTVVAAGVGGAKSKTRIDSTAYVLGEWILWTSGTTISECTQAGTSGVGTAAPTTVGQVVTDGTAKFTCRSLTTVAFTSEGNL